MLLLSRLLLLRVLQSKFRTHLRQVVAAVNHALLAGDGRPSLNHVLARDVRHYRFEFVLCLNMTRNIIMQTLGLDATGNPVVQLSVTKYS